MTLQLRAMRWHDLQSRGAGGVPITTVVATPTCTTFASPGGCAHAVAIGRAERYACRHALAERDWPNSYLGRSADPHNDALTAVVAFASDPPPAEMMNTLLSCRPASLAVVLVNPPEPVGINIDCRADQLTIEDLGLTCSPQPIEPERVGALATLVATPDPDAEAEAAEQLELIDLRGNDARGADEDPDYDVLVRLLGDIRVEGGTALRPKQTAVLAYIALHRTVTAEKIQDACWASPTTNDHRKRLANTISACRKAIGGHHLPVASDGRYVAGPKLLTDTALFDVRIKRAAHQSPENAADTLLSALELVTGPVFTYRNADRDSFAWVDLENLVSTWEPKIAGVAQHCTELLLDLDRVDDAIAVALHALDIIPTHPGLTESLMRAHAAKGDRIAIQRVYQAHVGALEKLDLDDVAESTADLYTELCRAKTG